MKPVIQSTKHIVQRPLLLIGEQTTSNISIARIALSPTSAPDVVVGSLIKAVFFEYWLLGESSQPCTATWSVEKLQNDATPMTQAQGQILEDYPNKNHLLKIGQGIIGDSNSNPIPIIREWVKIPKGMQRMAIGDTIEFNISCIGEADNGLEICGFALFKSYR